ncbi:MAG: hypothetical protein QOI92_2996, partial [Chloroflexota bacterium]|nr:hypothetical protein [Chloroflexota bacterium]
MSTTRDPDRLLRAWLDLMPDEAPDRAIAAVLQATESAPQVRRPFGLASWRFPSMNRFLPAAAVLAIVVIAVGAFAFSQSKVPGPGGNTAQPTISATSQAPATPSLSPLPAALQHLWIGDYRAAIGIQPGAATAITFGATTSMFAQANTNPNPRINSVASVTADGHLRLDTVSGIGCHAGDTGTYGYSLSTSGRVLTISPSGTDTCIDRTTALVGTWVLSGCKMNNDPCLGDLDAGTYGSIAFAPHLTGGVWAPVYGNVRYTVPDGWANAEDFPNSLRIVPTTEFATEDQNGPTLTIWPGIQLMARAHVPDKPGDCSDQQDPGKNLSYAELIASIKALPALTVSNVGPVTIGGLPGTSLDLAVAPAWTGKCSGLALPSY